MALSTYKKTLASFSHHTNWASSFTWRRVILARRKKEESSASAKALSPVSKGDFSGKRNRFQKKIWSAKFPARTFLVFGSATTIFLLFFLVFWGSFSYTKLIWVRSIQFLGFFPLFLLFFEGLCYQNYEKRFLFTDLKKKKNCSYGFHPRFKFKPQVQPKGWILSSLEACSEASKMWRWWLMGMAM